MVDFSKMLVNMRAERERVAGLTPEQREMENANKIAKMQKDRLDEEDRRVFSNRPLREVSVYLSGETRNDGLGMLLGARNAHGPFQILVPVARADALAPGESKSELLHDAFMATENAENRQSAVPAKAEGYFTSRKFDDSNGVEQKRWYFVAAKLDFEHAGATHTVGHSIERAIDSRSASATESVSAGNKDSKTAKTVSSSKQSRGFDR